MTPSPLNNKQIEMVKTAIGVMLENKASLAESNKSTEHNLKSLLTNAGASPDDLQAIMNYFEDVEMQVDSEQHVGFW